MAVINHATNEVTFKIVYCGTPMGGKTTNLQYIHSRIDGGQRGDLVSLATSTDRTLYFDFLPINTVVINGYKTKFMLYTVPGQVCYNATRQLVLKGVDGIVFVADSQPETMEINVQSLRTLVKNLQDNGTPWENLPVVFQYNKRDLPNATPVAYLEYLLNNGVTKRPWFEASASSGWQVFATLNAVADQILGRFHKATLEMAQKHPGRGATPAAGRDGRDIALSSQSPLE
jgi:signal recognition particle receptor subunit beta